MPNSVFDYFFLSDQGGQGTNTIIKNRIGIYSVYFRMIFFFAKIDHAIINNSIIIQLIKYPNWLNRRIEYPNR